MIRPGFRSASDRRELGACVRRQREDPAVARRANEADDLSLAWVDTPNVGFARHFPVKTPDEANTVQPSGTLAKESHIGEQ